MHRTTAKPQELAPAGYYCAVSCLMNSYFAIVSPSDSPIFDIEVFKPDYLSKLENNRHLHQSLLFCALDVVDDVMWRQNAMYLKTIDRYNEWMTSVFLTLTGDRFMLLHDVKNDDNIKLFFAETYELYIKHIMNPFYRPHTDIKSSSFEVKVRLLAKKYLEK